MQYTRKPIPIVAANTAREQIIRAKLICPGPPGTQFLQSCNIRYPLG